eukprot:gene18883-20784_t
MDWFEAKYFLLFAALIICNGYCSAKILPESDLVKADTNEQLGEILDGIDQEENEEENAARTNFDEIKEAVDSGTYVPQNDKKNDHESFHNFDEVKEAMDSGTYVPDENVKKQLERAKLEEVKEAMDSGTYVPDENVKKQLERAKLEEVKEAMDSGTYIPEEHVKENDKEQLERAKVEEVKEAMDSGTYVPEEHVKENDKEQLKEANVDELKEAIDSGTYVPSVDGAKNLIDGDIHPPPLTNDNDSDYEKRNAIRNKGQIWRTRVLPYVFDSSLAQSAINVIKKAMNDVASKSCIKFKEVTRSSKEHYINFFYGGGLVERKERNFRKYPENLVSGLGLPYDYDGLMHYGPYAFAKDRSKPTIIKLKNTGGSIGQRIGLSKTDIEQLNTQYDCKTSSVTNSWSKWSKWSNCIKLSKGWREYSQRFCFLPNPSACVGANSAGTQWRDRPCSGPVTPTNPAPGQQTNKPKPTKPSVPGSVNEPICGTRSSGLSHPGLIPQNIVGGTTVQPGDWPWQVGFARASSTFIYCGGTLINKEWIVSAAHCFSSTNPSGITARLGEHNKRTNEGREQVISLAKVIIHESYNRKTLANDIALLKLSKPATYNKYVRPACLPDKHTIIKDGQMSFVSGWGTTTHGGSTSDILRVAKVPIVGQTACKKSLTVGPTMICAGYPQGGIDACQQEKTHGHRVPTTKATYNVLINSPSPGPVPTPTPGSTALLSCTFESDICNWQQAKDDKFDWTRRSGGTPSSGTGPSSSATGAGGYYLYIETSYPRKDGDKATLRSPVLMSNTPTCLKFKANMYGSNIKTLEVSSVISGSKTSMLKITGNKGQNWFDKSIDLPVGKDFQVEITGARGTSYQGDIAIDELRVVQGSCNPMKPTPKPTVKPDNTPLLSCTFESDVCNWQQAKDDKFDWTRRSGSTPSSGTGPSSSATGTGGYFVYIETSYPRRDGDQATLRSPSVFSNTPTCLKFKANMYGSTIKTLEVSSVISGSKTSMLKITGNKGQNWFDKSIDLPVGKQFQVEITGTRGASYQGDIAIDELRVVQGSCNPMKPTQKPTVKPDTTPLLSCTFESDVCNWQQAKDDKFDWTRRSGSTPSSGTGPSSSATGTSGYYVYIETSYPRRDGDKATLRSPSVFSNTPTCLKFKANMYGSTIKTLEVSSVISGSKTSMLKITGNKGQNWFDKSIDLPVGKDFQLEITGTRGASYKGDIAIDELRIVQGSCSSPKPTVSGSCGVPQIVNARVIAGINAVRGSWPWQILLRYKGRPMCGGTLINENTVVTAAHCVSGRESNPASFSVSVGEHDTRINEGSEDTITASKVESSPKYSRRTIDYDIAVIKLSRKANAGKFVGFACLPNANEEPPVGSDCYITGFGKVKHPGNMHHTLQQARIKVRSQADCQAVNGNRYGVKVATRTMHK